MNNIQGAAAGTNSITVSFSGTPNWEELRVLEYGGLDTQDPFDSGNGGYGTGTTANTGSITTAYPNELLVESPVWANAGTTPGANFRWLPLAYPGACDWPADRIVTSTGSYSDAPTQSPSGLYLTQIAGFH